MEPAVAEQKPPTSASVGRRVYVYAASVTGKFQQVHRWSGVLLQAILFVTPWIIIGGHPALLIDIPNRRLFFFGEIFAATDTVYLVLIGLFSAFLLFFVTSLFGRLWCGYACPQTVFLEEWVRRIETAIEGERGQRMALDRAPWTAGKLARKLAKWSAFLVLSAVVAMSFVSYFADAYKLWTGNASVPAYAFVGFFTAIMYLDFAWFREQFCNYLCPYARFQGALTDDHSLVIGYDVKRGEPRHKPRANVEGAGACVDCNKCVVVCPTGIDIRDGYQLECIACARCIDACHSVMEKRGTLPSLVTYTTEARMAGGTSRYARPRTFVYGGLLAAIAVLFLVLLDHHHTLEASVNRAPGTLFAIDPDGSIRNTYMLRVVNNHPTQDGKPVVVKVKVKDMPGAEVIVQDITLAESEQATVPLIVRMKPEADGHAHTVPIRVKLMTDFDEVFLNTTFALGGGSVVQGTPTATPAPATPTPSGGEG